MFEHKNSPTKVLVIDGDDLAFQIRACIANAVAGLPDVELIHAHDATEALAMIEKECPHVILFHEDAHDEQDLLMDSLSHNHPPIVLESEKCKSIPTDLNLEKKVTHVPKNDTLEGIHQTMQVVTALGVKFSGSKTPSRGLH